MRSEETGDDWKDRACCQARLPDIAAFRVLHSMRGILWQGRGAAWSGFDASVSRASGGTDIAMRGSSIFTARRG